MSLDRTVKPHIITTIYVQLSNNNFPKGINKQYIIIVFFTAGANPSWQWMLGSVQPGQVASLSQGFLESPINLSALLDYEKTLEFL